MTAENLISAHLCTPSCKAIVVRLLGFLLPRPIVDGVRMSVECGAVQWNLMRLLLNPIARCKFLGKGNLELVYILAWVPKWIYCRGSFDGVSSQKGRGGVIVSDKDKLHIFLVVLAVFIAIIVGALIP